MKKKAIRITLLCLGCLLLLVLLLGCEYQYVTYILEATQIQSKVDYMRSGASVLVVTKASRPVKIFVQMVSRRWRNVR